VPGLKITKAQLTQGASASVLTLGVRDAGTSTVLVNASACNLDQGSVAAVGAWPLQTLAPEQATELPNRVLEGVRPGSGDAVQQCSDRRPGPVPVHVHPQAAEAGGVGGAMDKLADSYMKMAENIFSVLEVDGGRGIELMINKGTSLKLK